MRPPSRPPSRTPRLAIAAMVGTLALVGLSACGSSAPSSDESAVGTTSATGSRDGGGGAEPGETSLGAPAVPEEAGKAGAVPVLPALAARKLARRADVALRVEDLTAAATRLRAIAKAAGGLVVAEEVSSDSERPTTPEGGLRPEEPPQSWGTITISVPSDKLDTTLDEVAAVGTVLSRRTSTDDVTAQYVDTASRVASMKASVERVRALMTRATRLADIVTLEGELSRRQADLEAMQQQLAVLEDQVALAPVTITLSTPGGRTPSPGDPTGFLAGLASGWEAFTTSVRLLLTLVGALLPFAVAGAVIVVPLVMWWRRRPRPAPAAPVAPPPA